jgi:hypothetical protein
MPARKDLEDRRLCDWGPPEGYPERRQFREQRTISVTEISLQEWESARGLVAATQSNPLGLRFD